MGKSAKDTSKQPQRLNRVTGLADALGKAIDPVFKKRGFASRDIVINWPAMAPKPYDKVALPDKLHWPRGEAGAEGAILFLRCADSHRLALAHEGQAIAAAINRYFGYVLVGAVKLSATPFTPGSGEVSQKNKEPSEKSRRSVNAALKEVEDEGLKAALEKLGLGLMNKN